MSRVLSVGRRNRVRAVRRAVDLTQAELASQVEVARQTIVALEAGDYAPSVYLALAISARLETTVESLFGDEAQSIQVGR
jgi:putative transcriptional regulator